VVIVTDAPALQAMAGGHIGFTQALDLGVVRLDGAPAEVAAARNWHPRSPLDAGGVLAASCCPRC